VVTQTDTVTELELATPQGVVNVRGYVLGSSSSRRDEHNHSPGDRPVDEGGRRRCAACRWLETTILEETDVTQPRYVVHTVGRSVIPGESDRPRLVRTDSASEVVETLHVSRRRLAGDGPEETFIPRPSLLALAQAADVDDDLRDAYRARRVVVMQVARPAA